MSNVEQGDKKIGISSIISWVFSIYFILLGINVLRFSGFPEGLFFILAGLLAVPNLNKLIKKLINVELTVSLRIILVVLLIGLGYFMQWNKAGVNAMLEVSQQKTTEQGQ
ncbi:MAG: hypothetical protein KJ710_04255 [Candidatus Omnitrophica bacterium]|nr:hypothetical protein [Candidatus Omnitrophota bacterium]MBU1923454.1 hypothetical protein [Candidatus Omnitrophota bacterium]